jgi:hypothetical protein
VTINAAIQAILKDMRLQEENRTRERARDRYFYEERQWQREVLDQLMAGIPNRVIHSPRRAGWSMIQRRIMGVDPARGGDENRVVYGVRGGPSFRIIDEAGVIRRDDEDVVYFHRQRRYAMLRQEGKTLGEINRILEEEGYPEVTHGAGLVACPTKQHEIVRKNEGARRMVEGL